MLHICICCSVNFHAVQSCAFLQGSAACIACSPGLSLLPSMTCAACSQSHRSPTASDADRALRRQLTPLFQVRTQDVAAAAGLHLTWICPPALLSAFAQIDTMPGSVALCAGVALDRAVSVMLLGLAAPA